MASLFNNDELFEKVPYGDFQITCLVSSDSYDETEILNRLKSLGSDAMRLLQQCAIHIAVIGAGNKSFGSIRLENDDVVPIIDIFDKYNIKYKNIVNSKLNPGELTPRRLVRFYRHCTHLFIKNNNRPSYLWLKYSDHNVKFRNICYPGAEHFITTKEEYQYLYNVYLNVDKILGTSFNIRLQRVGIARGLYDPSIL